MLSLTTACLILLFSPSPLKLSVVVILFSFILSLTMLRGGVSSMMFNSIIISFTTGMMIMFCYCSSLTYFESKTMSNFKMWTTAVIFFISVNISDNLIFSVTSPQQEMSLMLHPLVMILLGVLIAMVAINALSLKTKNLVLETY